MGYINMIDEHLSKETIEELEYLRYFFSAADFGPADSDVRDMIREDYALESDLDIPEGY